MKIEQSRWASMNGWEPRPPGNLGRDAQLVFLFGGTSILKQQKYIDEVRTAYPSAQIAGCSTAGEIYDTHVSDDTLVITAVQFEHTSLKIAHVDMEEVESSLQAGERLAKALDKRGLIHVFVLSDGLVVNGSDLVAGLTRHLSPNIAITGGLCGDGDRFQETYVLQDDLPKQHVVTALGFYGDRLRVGYGSLGGWDSFGPERLITKSTGNVLYELDGQPALALYKKYLADQAEGLPATGLLYPLSLSTLKGDIGVVRTILAVDHDKQSLTFAGEVPEGSYARLMKANFNRLIDGALGAAKVSYESIGGSSPDLAVLISCVGRKLVLKQRIEEEVEAVRDVLGDRTILTGFYSYGEISPFTPGATCELHNQTMTITTFSES